MLSQKSLLQRIQAIESRNKRVETDKLWETSYTRRFLIAIFTFLSIGIYMWAVGIDRPWLNAVIPTLGFTLSTLTLPWFKEVWKKIL